MKRYLVLLLVSSVFLVSNAQDDDFQTIFGSGPLRVSGFGGPMMNFTSVDGQFAHFMGGGGGVIINNAFFGGFGMGKTNPIDMPDYPNDDLQVGYGGLWMGYSFMGNKAIHPAFHVKVGWGSITHDESSLRPSEWINTPDDDIFVVSPALELEMNFSRFFRLGAGVNYTLFQGVDIYDYSNGDFSGLGAHLMFKFGWF